MPHESTAWSQRCLNCRRLVVLSYDHPTYCDGCGRLCSAALPRPEPEPETPLALLAYVSRKLRRGVTDADVEALLDRIDLALAAEKRGDR